ncbi:MAG: DNA glycosylase [Comamonadaceae bacterium]|nr:DNA glycosylase [Comamonadaceae bacterium]
MKPPATEQPVETHPFAPVLPPHATVMMMGSFPPTADKRSMAFHYPNFQNDMWRIYGLVFFDDPMHFQDGQARRFDAQRIRAFLQQRGIALCPTVRRAIRQRGNASDAFLQVVEAVDLPAVLAQVPHCRALFTTGGKATEVLLEALHAQQDGQPNEPPDAPHPMPPRKALKTGQSMDFPYAGRALRLFRLPSTSRAYPLSLARKAQAYRAFFQQAGLLD